MAIDNLVPTVNGVAYTHADIVLNIGAVPIVGVTSIDYSDNQQMTANYSTGNKPTSVGFGQVEFSASITITFETMQLIQLGAPGGKIQNILFFDVGINYLPESGVLVRDVLRRCRFKGRSQNSETGNSEIPVTLELYVSDIDYQRV
jgi:hypothetical protein